MPITNDSLNKDLYRLLKVRGFEPIPKDSEGETSPVPDDADVFKFTFKRNDKPMGTAWVTIDSTQKLVVYYNDEINKQDGIHESDGITDFDDSWTGFLKNLKMWAQRRQLGFELQNQDHLASDMAQRTHMKKKENISENKKITELAKWRQGFRASGHPPGHKHKSGEIGPLGGTFDTEKQWDDEKKVPVHKYRDEADPLADRHKAGISTTGKPLLPKNKQRNLKDMIKRSKQLGPVGHLPEQIEEESEQSLIYISVDKVDAFEDWMESEGLDTSVPKRDEGTYVVYDYSDSDHASKMYADDWNEKREDQDVSETKVGNYKDMGATSDTTHFIKNVTTGKIVSPHRSRQDAEDALIANKRGSKHEFKIVRARKEGVAEGQTGKPIKPGRTFRFPNHWNKADVVHEFLWKKNAVVDVEYSYDTKKWTVTDSRPATEKDMEQWATINGGLPSVNEQGVAEGVSAQDKNISVGDYVQTAAGVEGVVKHISPDGKKLTIWNRKRQADHRVDITKAEKIPGIARRKMAEQGVAEGPHGGDDYTLGNPVDKEYVYQVWRTANDVRDYKNMGKWVHDGGTTHSLADAKRRKDALIKGTHGVKAKIVRVPRSQFKLAGPQGHLPEEMGRRGVAEGPVDTVKKGIKHIKRVATGKDLDSRIGQEITKSHQAVMRGDYATSKKHFDRYDKLDKLANKKQGMAEGNSLKLDEGYYPMGKQASYSDAIPTIKIVLQHTRQIQEGEQRFRNVARIFLENTQGERILCPFNRPGMAQVFARHLAEGGKPNDERWNHIKSLCEEYNNMAGFARAVKNHQFNESAQKLVEAGVNHFLSLRESLSKMRGHRGYNTYFESWTPTLMETEGDENTNLNELFVQETLDPRIESVMPILSKLNKNLGEMKEVNELAEWAENVTDLEEDVDTGEYDARKTTPSSKEEQDKVHAKHRDRVQKLRKEMDDEDKKKEVEEGLVLAEPDDDEIDGDDKKGNGKKRHTLDPDIEAQLARYGINVDDDLPPIRLNDFKSKKSKGVAEEQGVKEGEIEDAEKAHQKIKTPAAFRKKQGGDWKVSGSDLEKSKARTGTSPEGLAAIKKLAGVEDGPKLSEDDSGMTVKAKEGDVEVLFGPVDSEGAIVSVRKNGQEIANGDYDRYAGKIWIGNDAFDSSKDVASHYASQMMEDELEEGLRDPKDNPCWKGYHPVGTKKKDGRTVPNCVPKESVEEDLDANQKRAGQLGPTEKVGPKGAVGKLVGANESVEHDPLLDLKRLLGK